MTRWRTSPIAIEANMPPITINVERATGMERRFMAMRCASAGRPADRLGGNPEPDELGERRSKSGVKVKAALVVGDRAGHIAEGLLGQTAPVVALLQDWFAHVVQGLGRQADHVPVAAGVVIGEVRSGL